MDSKANSIRFNLIMADQITFHLPLLRLFCSRKVLFYCHFPDKLLVQPGKNGFLHRSLYRRVFDWAEGVCLAAGASKIVVNSRFTQAAFLQAFPRLSQTPIVLYPGVECDSAIEKKKARILSTCFLSLNRFERKKDVELAIEALALMRNKHATLVVAGGFDPKSKENVEYLTELEALCFALNLEHSRNLDDLLSARVFFAPSIDELKKGELMGFACALLYTPQNEHFGIVPVEAMSRGLPVIAMKSGGPKETISPGKSGWLCSQRDPHEMAALMDGAVELTLEQREKIGMAAKERVQNLFSSEVFSKNLNSIVQEMLK